MYGAPAGANDALDHVHACLYDSASYAILDTSVMQGCGWNSGADWLYLLHRPTRFLFSLLDSAVDERRLRPVDLRHGFSGDRRGVRGLSTVHREL